MTERSPDADVSSLSSLDESEPALRAEILALVESLPVPTLPLVRQLLALIARFVTSERAQLVTLPVFLTSTLL